jgi:hypothetical protein
MIGDEPEWSFKRRNKRSALRRSISTTLAQLLSSASVASIEG